MTTNDLAWGETRPAATAWSFGKWHFELRDDEIADLRFDGDIVLRSIRGVARDRNWDTVAATVTSATVGPQCVILDIGLVGGEADLVARLHVEAIDDELTVRWSVRARAPFVRNRLGLVVLHPATLAGDALRVTHSDGTTEVTSFPEMISPHQPAFDIRALSWRHGRVSTDLEFTGDVFEMEDQRNWTDASFKTYSTPLSVRFPVLVTTGDTVEHTIRVACSAHSSNLIPPRADRIELVATGRPAPSMGTAASTGPSVSSTPPPAGGPLLIEIPAQTDVWRDALSRAVIEAGDLQLDIRIIGATGDRLDEVLDAIAGLKVSRVGIFSGTTHGSETADWDALRSGLAARGLEYQTLGGTRAHFAELNRTVHRLPATIPAYAFSITPQMHATDREQIVESLAIQRLVAEGAVRLTNRPVHIGPVTLAARFNAVATTVTPDAVVKDLSHGYGAGVNPGATDPRQQAPAVLAWTIASAAALSVAGVESISWFEASGPRGLRSVDGEDYPVATAMNWLSEIAGRPLFATGQSPPDLWAIGAPGIALVANMRNRSAQVTVVLDGNEQLVEIAALSAVRLDFA